MKRRLVAITVLAALTAGLWLGATAVAQTDDAIGVQITPARLERDLNGRTFRFPVRVINNDSVGHAIELSVARLGHDLDGTPLFLDPSYVSGAASISRDAIELGPGQATEIEIEGAIPEGDRSIYPSVVAEFEGASMREVEVRARVAGFFFLRGPKPWHPEIRVVDVGALPASDDEVTLFGAVRNTGDVHVRPRGFIDVSQDGRRLARVRLRGEVIIPTFARRLTATWDPPEGLTGTVDLDMTLRSPDGQGSGSLLLDQGVPQLPAASIDNLVAEGDGGGRLSFVLTNTGGIDIEPELVVSAIGDTGTSSDERREPTLAPEESRSEEWDTALEPGVYTVRVQVRHDGLVLDESVVGLEVPGPGWLRWIALALLIAAASGLAVVVRARERATRRPMEAVTV